MITIIMNMATIRGKRHSGVICLLFCIGLSLSAASFVYAQGEGPEDSTIYIRLDLEEVWAEGAYDEAKGPAEEARVPSKPRPEKKGLFKKVKFIQAADIDETDWGVEHYYIGIGDLLEISIWQIEALHRDVIVRPDGKISFPLIGDLMAEGKTIEELRDEIVAKIKVYIKSPQVSVNILEFGGKKAVILGEINGPGVIRFNSPTSVMEAVGLAGDFTYNANKDKLFIVRDLDTEEPTVIAVNANSILTRGNLKENIFIKSEDIIYIPRAFIADFRHFMNSVFGPLVNYAQTYYGDTWRRRKAGKWRHVIDERWP